MTLLLRTLARKSVFDFGKFKDRSVQQCIDLDHTRMLRWYYYNCSMISFLPDILDEIGIPEEWRITKPGKDPEKGEKLDDMMNEKIAKFRKAVYNSGDEKMMGRVNKAKSKYKKRKKAEAVSFERQDNRKYSKSSMQAVNHGHGRKQQP